MEICHIWFQFKFLGIIMKLVISLFLMFLFFLKPGILFAECLEIFSTKAAHTSDSHTNKPANSKSTIHEGIFSKKENVINEKYSSAVVQIASLKSLGTAFFISPDTLVTNFHVIGALTEEMGLIEDQLFVEVSGKDLFPVESIAALDSLSDLAVLKIKDFTSPHYISLKEVSPSSQEIQTAGFPQSDMFTGTISETKGFIFYEFDKFIRIKTQKRMGGGASGAPVLFKNGALAGIIYKGVKGGVLGESGVVSVDRLKELLAKSPLNCRSALCVTKERERIHGLANQGDSLAQFHLAEMYLTGKGVNQSFEKAFYWMQKSADQGYLYAQKELAGMYFSGYGANQDYKKAFDWFQKSAAQDYPLAQFNLAVMYLLGYGVNQDYKKAFYWMQKSADQAHPHAQYSLAGMYFEAKGVNQNYKKAFDLYLKLADQGVPPAQFNLAGMYRDGNGVNQDYEKAFYWMQKSANQGDSSAQYDLAGMYRKGEGVNQDYEKAFDWMQKSAVQGDSSAQYNLAVMYLFGLGADQSFRMAYDWLKKRAVQGSL